MSRELDIEQGVVSHGGADRLAPDDARRVAATFEVPPNFAEIPLYQVLLRAPEFAKSFSGLMLSILDDEVTDVRVRELVLLRIAWITPCPTMWAAHWSFSRERLDLAPELLVSVRDWQSADGLDPSARAALALTDDLVRTRRVGAEAWSQVVAAYPTEEERVHLVGAIAMYRMVADVLNVFQIPYENGSLWPPDGAVPEWTPT